ncbi:AP-4 complex accessory subunit tepsin [Pseudophryne corroboree]|uniref:AP-4 complex accessory subunit tepsin n=1 Tax=Pseudophryne corroboree TaxID=495146 RepID=UPI003081F1DA
MAVLDRLTFLHQLPLLIKGTSDDDTPCPGYLYEEIAKIPLESPGSCRCLLEYLLNRLQSSSCNVKLKVLKILLYLCTHGSDQFIQDLRRNLVYIQEAAAVGGPPDPLHGISMYQKVRCTAQELVSSLFSDITPPVSNVVPTKSQTGMGSQVFRPQTMQGFGFSQEKNNSGTPSEVLLSGIQRAAVAVTQAVLVGTSLPPSCVMDQAEDMYKPVAVPIDDRCPPAEKTPGAHTFRGSYRTGVAGGGWDDSDSGHSSQDSLPDKPPHSRSSDAGSKTGSDGQSRSSIRESTERVEPAHPGDCLQEAQLVLTVIRGQKVFLTQEEVQLFVRGCSLLNCEVVFEMLNHSLEGDDTCVKLRSMCAIASLMTSDLLSHDHMLSVVRKTLLKLSKGPPGPVVDKARKILLQFEALTRTSPMHRAARHVPTPPSPQSSSLDLLTDVFPEPDGDKLLTPSSLIPESSSTNAACCGFRVNGPMQDRSQSMDTGARAPDSGSAVEGDSEVLAQTVTCGQLSLFDGMELVTPVRSTIVDHTSHDTTMADTVVHGRTLKPCLPSVFSFLNS